MKRAIVIYSSRTGTTKKFGEQISEFLNVNKIESKVISIDDYKADMINGTDYVFLGCWTNGFMLMFQHPSKVWVEFAQKLPDLQSKKVVLFTTYKIATGVMFKAMRKHLSGEILLELKSRNGKLDTQQKEVIIDSIIK